MNLKNTPINHLMFSDNILQYIANCANCKGLANHVHNEDISMKMYIPDIADAYFNEGVLISFDCDGLKIPDELEMCCYGCPFYKKKKVHKYASKMDITKDFQNVIDKIGTQELNDAWNTYQKYLRGDNDEH